MSSQTSARERAALRASVFDVILSQGAGGPLTPRQIAQRLDADVSAVVEEMKQLADDGHIEWQGAIGTRRHERVFIGHGNSKVWQELKDFLVERLRLDVEEFNRNGSVAGFSVLHRLREMLDRSTFAFLVMTAEDERADGSFQARANVIHEAGLFQGRLGFERAILLVEEGCTLFSNMEGTVQIRFPRGDIMRKTEQIREVLLREGLIS